MKKSEISFNEFCNRMLILYDQGVVFTDELPDIVKEDFHNFIVGHTLTSENGRVRTYDFKMYYDKVFKHDGLGYDVQWPGTAKGISLDRYKPEI